MKIETWTKSFIRRIYLSNKFNWLSTIAINRI